MPPCIAHNAHSLASLRTLKSWAKHLWRMSSWLRQISFVAFNIFFSPWRLRSWQRVTEWGGGGGVGREHIWFEVMTYVTTESQIFSRPVRPDSVNKHFIIWPPLSLSLSFSLQFFLSIFLSFLLAIRGYFHRTNGITPFAVGSQWSLFLNDADCKGFKIQQAT